jgi:hypothetical protein
LARCSAVAELFDGGHLLFGGLEQLEKAVGLRPGLRGDGALLLCTALESLNLRYRGPEKLDALGLSVLPAPRRAARPRSRDQPTLTPRVSTDAKSEHGMSRTGRHIPRRPVELYMVDVLRSRETAQGSTAADFTKSRCTFSGANFVTAGDPSQAG